MITRVKGTQDFLNLSLLNFLIDKFKKHAQLYHFTEIAIPIIEHLELFKRSLGTYTDVVSKEMFIIQPHTQDEQDLICLRPEATAGVMRAFIENQVQQTPWKVYTYGPMFRYERPQKGRFRQFHQINMEIIGSANIHQDAQLIAMLDRFFHEQLNLNNYALLINFIGCPNDREKYRAALVSFLDKQTEICKNCLIRKDKNPLRVFDCKEETCQKIYQNAPFITQFLCATCDQEWQELQQTLHLLSISYAVKPTLVRGLDYYNKTVFEFASANLGAQNAFCGGGRYDQLATLIGAKEDQPSVGAAIGIDRLLLLLEPMIEQLSITPSPTIYALLPMSKTQQPLALLIADTLHAHGLCAQVILEGDSMKSLMRQANKLGAACALIIGEEEQQTRTVTVKNMTTGDQKRIAQQELVANLKK